MSGLAILTGLIAGYGAIGFRFLIGFFQNMIMHGRLDFRLASPLEHVRGPWIVIIPPLGLLFVAYLVRTFARETEGHGVPEVMEAVLTRGGKIRKRVVSIKALASSLTLGVGGSVGREGPIVQIGSAAGSTIGQLLHVRPKHLKVLVGCGAAGAIAATFNTPVAGVIFAIELIVLEWSTQSFVPLVISSVFATVISRWHLGNEPSFAVPGYSLVHPTELVFYLGLGITAGLVGALIIWALYRMEDLFRDAPLPFVVKPLLGGLALGAIGYVYPQILGVGYETVTSALNEGIAFPLMLTLILVKILAMSLTLGAGGSGGVFAPSLFVGAMLGGTFGSAVNQFFPAISAGYGSYALVGMAAVFAATSRATFTAIVILFEMTLDYSIILPLMFACVVADQVSVALVKDSTIYSLKLKRKGIPFVSDLGVNVLAVTPIREIMTANVKTVHVEATLRQSQEVISQSRHAVYPVVNSKGVFMGTVRTIDIDEAIQAKGPDVKISEVALGTVSVAYGSETVLSGLKRVGHSRDPRIIVVDRRTKVVVGIVSSTDLLRLSSRELE